MNEAEPQNYEAQWLALSRYELMHYVVWIGGAVLALVLSVHFPAMTMVFGIFWMGGFFAAGVPSGNFCCPRCGKKFFSRPDATGNRYNRFTSKCLNCGLPKWQSQI